MNACFGGLGTRLIFTLRSLGSPKHQNWDRLEQTGNRPPPSESRSLSAQTGRAADRALLLFTLSPEMLIHYRFCILSPALPVPSPACALPILSPSPEGKSALVPGAYQLRSVQSPNAAPWKPHNKTPKQRPNPSWKTQGGRRGVSFTGD